MSATGDSLANAYRKIVVPQIAGASGTSLSGLWAAQNEAKYRADTWRETPVDIFTFARDFLGRTNLSEFHHDALRAFAGDDPQTWSERFKVIGLCWGMTGGKNFTSEIMVTYTMYRLLLLVNPHRYFSLDPTSSTDILNISFVNERQAAEIFFDRLKETIRATIDPGTGRNWFAAHGVDLRDRGIGDIKEKIIILPRNIRARCLPFTQAAFEGSNILVGVFDEPSRAVTSPPANQRAHKLFAKIFDNTTGRFGRRGKLVAFSYPEAQDDDLIMELFARARTQYTLAGRRERPEGDADYYGSLGASYDVNPRLKREDFENQRKSDPDGVATRIDCNPPHSRTGFYRAYPEKVTQSFCLKLRDDVVGYDVVPITHRVQSNGKLITKTYTGVKLLWARGDDRPRVLGGDPGESSDIFALALARTERSNRKIEVERVVKRKRPEERPPIGHFGRGRAVADVIEENKVELSTIDHKVIVDGLIEIVPIRYNRTDENTGRTVTDTYPISFVSVCDFILKLKAHFPRLELAAFDKWQSSELIERLIMGGIRAESLTFTSQQQYQLYWQHRALVYNDMMFCLESPTKVKDTPRAGREFLDLQEVIPGRKVDHKPEGSKDSADAIVIATHLALEQAISGAGSKIFML